MNLLKYFNKLCDPAKLYLLLAFSSVLIYLIHFVRLGNIPSIQDLVMQVAVMVIWTFILNKVCTFKYGVKISWFLVALPVIFMILGLILMYFFIDQLDISKDDLKDIMYNAKQIRNKQEEDEDGLEGFQGCGSGNLTTT